MNNLSLLTGAEIPFPEGRLIIHQPRLQEIGYIGEDTFFLGCSFLSFSKDALNDKDKVRLIQIDDFNILMSIMNDQNIGNELRQSIDSAYAVLVLLFPTQSIVVDKEQITIGEEGFINKNNFAQFKAVLKEIFQLSFKTDNVQTDFNPADDKAAAIVAKLKQRHAQLSKLNGGDGKTIQIFGRYMSIISAYSGISLVDLSQYTVFQLYDAFNRMQLKIESDIAFEAKLAGASDVKNPENWMKDLYTK